MKKIIFIFSLFIALTACTGNSTKPIVGNDSIVDSIEVIDSSMIDTINIDFD